MASKHRIFKLEIQKHIEAFKFLGSINSNLNSAILIQNLEHIIQSDENLEEPAVNHVTSTVAIGLKAWEKSCLHMLTNLMDNFQPTNFALSLQPIQQRLSSGNYESPMEFHKDMAHIFDEFKEANQNSESSLIGVNELEYERNITNLLEEWQAEIESCLPIRNDLNLTCLLCSETLHPQTALKGHVCPVRSKLESSPRLESTGGENNFQDESSQECSMEMDQEEELSQEKADKVKKINQKLRIKKPQRKSISEKPAISNSTPIKKKPIKVTNPFPNFSLKRALSVRVNLERLQNDTQPKKMDTLSTNEIGENEISKIAPLVETEFNPTGFMATSPIMAPISRKLKRPSVVLSENNMETDESISHDLNEQNLPQNLETSVPTPEQINLNMRTVREGQVLKFECLQCNKIFGHKRSVQRHIHNVHFGKNYSGRFCPHKTRSKARLVNHEIRCLKRTFKATLKK